MRQKIEILVLGVFAVLLIVFSTVYCKKRIHFDELFSYGSANTPYSYSSMVPMNEWVDAKEMFSDYLCVNNNDRFDYSMVWENQSQDVHPPLYYAIIHTICSFCPNYFSIWIAIGINIVFFVLTIPAVYGITHLICGSHRLSLAVSFSFCCSNLMVDLALFLRMYILLCCITMWMLLYMLKWLNDKKRSDLLFVYLLVYLGALVHYYSLIFTFFLVLGSIIYLIYNKQTQYLIKYIIGYFAVGIVYLISYPASIKHILFGYRGQEAMDRIKTTSGLWEGIMSYMQQIGSKSFFSTWVLYLFMAVAFIVGILCIFFKKGSMTSDINSLFYLIVMFVSIGYFVIIVRVSSMSLVRYVVPVIPLLLILVWGSLYTLAAGYLSENLLCVVIVAFTLCSFSWNSFFTNHEEPQAQIAEEYMGSDCLLVESEEDWRIGYNTLNNYLQLKNFASLYYISKPYGISSVDEKLKSETELVVYFDTNEDVEKNKQMILDYLPQMKVYTPLYEASESEVYLLH